MRTEFIQEYLVFGRHLNFSRAAEELHISQPNLSKHMAELEREVGVELIDRKTYGKNRPVLSAAGKFFFEEMSFLDASYQSTLNRCRAIGRLGMRDIRIQELWQNNAMVMLYLLAGAYQHEHFENEIRFLRLTEKQPVDALLENEFDVVFDVWCGDCEARSKQLSDKGVKTVALVTEPPVIWYQEGNRFLEELREVRLEDLLGIPVIITRGNSYDYMVYSYVNYCERMGLSPRLRHLQPFDNSPTGMFMSDFNDGVLMTTPAMEQDPRLRSRSDLKYATITDERLAVTFSLAVRVDDRQAVAFLDYVASHRSNRMDGRAIINAEMGSE